jgi:hypothetical protein
MKTLGLLKPLDPDIEPPKYYLVELAEDATLLVTFSLIALITNVTVVTNMDISLPIALTKLPREIFVKPALNLDIFIETVLKIDVINVINMVILELTVLLLFISWTTKDTDVDVHQMK